MQTVVQLETFNRSAKGLLDESMITEVIDTLAADPSVGDVIKGTGGFRKVRFKLRSKGKSGGIRVIYFYHNKKIPLFLAQVYSKAVSTNLTQDQQNTLKALSLQLIKSYGAKK